MGFITTSPIMFRIGKSIEELVGAMNILQYSLEISTGSMTGTWDDSTVGGFTAFPWSCGDAKPFRSSLSKLELLNSTTGGFTTLPWSHGDAKPFGGSSSQLELLNYFEPLLVISSTSTDSRDISSTDTLFITPSTVKRIFCGTVDVTGYSTDFPLDFVCTLTLIET